MSFLIDPYRFSTAVPTIYDDVTAFYSLRRADMSVLWTNAVAKVRRSSDNATSFLFIDGSSADDTISTSSFISTTSNTTPDATTFSTWLGSDDFYYESIYAQTPDNVINTGKTLNQTNVTLQPQGGTSGAITNKNGKPLVDTLTGSRYMQIPTSYGLLAYDQEFTILSVSHNDVSASNGVLWTTSTLSTSYLVMLNDRRTNKKAINQFDSGSLISTELTAQVNSSNQRLLTCIHDATNNILYYNGTLQNTVAHTSVNYTNDQFRVGALGTGGTSLQGGFQEVIIYASDKATDISSIHTDIDTYYSIP